MSSDKIILNSHILGPFRWFPVGESYYWQVCNFGKILNISIFVSFIYNRSRPAKDLMLLEN